MVLALCVALASGCAKQSVQTAAAPRAVKVEAVAERSVATHESFIGTLRARQRAELSFGVPGRIAAVLVDVGDTVRAGQVLARLQESPVQWRLDKALADRAAALATLAERNAQLQRHEALAKEQIVALATLDAVRTQQELAASHLQTADAALALARRDLALSRITAPFDGEIVARMAQPDGDVGAGQPVLRIEAGQTLEVVAMLPENVTAHLAAGARATLTIASPASAERTLAMTLERLSARSESGSLVQAVFGIAAADGMGLRSGRVVSFELPRAGGPAISVPAAALLPATERGSGSVFVLDAATSRVVRRAVTVADAILPDGRIPVTSGLVAGDRVVVAGAAFLSDGEPAVVHVAQTLLHGTPP
jgi:RND family efflux transporter MFP subunit